MNVGKRIDESILKWRNKMLWLSMLFLSVSLFSDEVSVFGAGNLDDELPYGLNQTEKKIVENNNKIKKLKSKIKELKKEIQIPKPKNTKKLKKI